MRPAETLLFYILTVIAVAVWWFYPEQWFWIAAAWWFGCTIVFGVFSLQRNNDVAGFFGIMIIQAMIIGTAAFWYLHPGQWWWIIPVWLCFMSGVKFLYHRLFLVPTFSGATEMPGAADRPGSVFTPEVWQS